MQAKAGAQPGTSFKPMHGELASNEDRGLSASAEWQRLRNALLDVASTPFSDPDAVRARLLRTDAEALGVDRVGLWMFEPGRVAIVCTALYETGKGVSRPGARIAADNAPNYFQSLQGLLTLAAGDARRDPRTQEFELDYLVPLGIGAMLDVPVRIFGEMVGVLCHEHVGGPRAWSDGERIFAAAMGVLWSQTMEFEKLQKAEREREQALFYDPLTGLPNRALFLDQLGQAARSSGAALLLLDIHGVGEIVEAYGADVGDAVLRETAARVKQVGRAGYAGRIGNDEFALLLPGEHAVAVASRVAWQLQEAMLLPMELSGQRLQAGFSIGLLPGVRHDRQPADALRDATIAVNAASRAGRNGIEIFRQGMDEPVRQRLALEADIRRGMAASEFCFHLQPVFGAEGGLQGAEALLRWQHHERGLLAPSEFLSVAEDSGLLHDLHWPLLPELCRVVAGWRTQVPGFQIGVNISPEQLALPYFPDDLVALITSAGMPAEALVAEITENTLLTHAGSDVPAIVRLAAAGVTIALDDFGTGFASITHLAELPLAVVKIDRTFVARAVGDPRYASIIESLVDLAHALSLRVNAEGVETEEQQMLLAQDGCDQLQGYWLGRPVSMAEFATRWMS